VKPPSPANDFLFATGIECSYPIITGKNGRRQRCDELEKAFHYRHWKQDLELVRELGLRYLRYGPPYYQVHLAPDRYDWEFTDLVFAEMRQLGITPIVDLCHFGVPDWIGDFQNPDWPYLFRRYAAAFAERFGWVQFYTPVNEISVCARFSTLQGIWNEQRHNDHRAFVTALKHLCRANLMAIEAILQRRSDAVFIQSETAEYYHAGSEDPETLSRARQANERRFLSFDLLYSVPPSTDAGLYLFDNGMSREDYRWFMSHGLGEHIIMGNDFYEQNERVVIPGGGNRPAGEVFGWSPITRHYYERFRRPVMHTETNTPDTEDAPRWLWKEFFNVLQLCDQGVPVLGFTWYSLTDQIDWDTALAEDLNRVHTVGLYDLQRRPRPVAAAYKELLNQFRTQPLFPGNRKLGIYSEMRSEERERDLQLARVGGTGRNRRDEPSG
jgi:beta-glucosidase/6-phospho-beta-glucosidase/beta-galactosidase